MSKIKISFGAITGPDQEAVKFNPNCAFRSGSNKIIVEGVN